MPDHPWQKAPKKAAVRIAMTVAEKGKRIGRLAEIAEERDLETDQPKVTLTVKEGQILEDLSIGIERTAIPKLISNQDLAHKGMQLNGEGFIISRSEAISFGLDSGADNIIKPFANGRDLVQRSRDVMVIDTYPLTEEELRGRYPKVYQRLLERVKPERDVNREPFRKKYWWWFGRTHESQRQALHGLNRYIVTTRTAKHRLFMFADNNLIAESKIVLVASDDAYVLGVLSSSFHLTFALREGGWLGVGNDPTYNHTDCFDPFPFPAATEIQKERIRALAEELDALRKKVLAEHDFLTMTKLYNVREKLKGGESLDESERAIHDVGCVSVIHELHNKIDAAVAEAYCWPSNLSDGEILGRLVTLNKERAEEEKRGLIRWLRPEYQAERTQVRAAKEEQIEADLAAPDAEAPALPKDDADLVALLRSRLRTIGKPIEPKALAQHFRDGGKGTRRVERGLRLLAAAGVVRRTEAGWFLPLDRAS